MPTHNNKTISGKRSRPNESERATTPPALRRGASMIAERTRSNLIDPNQVLDEQTKMAEVNTIIKEIQSRRSASGLQPHSAEEFKTILETMRTIQTFKKKIKKAKLSTIEAVIQKIKNIQDAGSRSPSPERKRNVFEGHCEGGLLDPKTEKPVLDASELMPALYQDNLYQDKLYQDKNKARKS